MALRRSTHENLCFQMMKSTGKVTERVRPLFEEETASYAVDEVGNKSRSPYDSVHVSHSDTDFFIETKIWIKNR